MVARDTTAPLRLSKETFDAAPRVTEEAIYLRRSAFK